MCWCLSRTPTVLKHADEIAIHNRTLITFDTFTPLQQEAPWSGWGHQVQPLQAPQGSAERGAGSPDRPAALLRGHPYAPGQAVRAPTQCGLPEGQGLLQR